VHDEEQHALWITAGRGAPRVTVRPDLAEVARVLGLPLPQLDRLVEVRVPWLPVTLWFVPGESEAEGLLADSVSRGRIWTAGELLDLLAVPGITKAAARHVALAKLEVDGEVTRIVRRPAPMLTPPAQPGWLPGLGGDHEPELPLDLALCLPPDQERFRL
jgi:hypothetical protein